VNDRLVGALIASAVLILVASMGYAVYFYQHCPTDYRVVTQHFGLACIRR
jgi:hypothetical protein